MKTYVRGKATAFLIGTFKDRANDLVDPADGAICYVWDEDGTVQVNGLACAKESTGVYYYNYSPAADAVLGEYKFLIIGVDGTTKSTGDDKFLVIDMP